jgi:hypothetical protein
LKNRQRGRRRRPRDRWSIDRSRTPPLFDPVRAFALTAPAGCCVLPTITDPTPCSPSFPPLARVAQHRRGGPPSDQKEPASPRSRSRRRRPKGACGGLPPSLWSRPDDFPNPFSRPAHSKRPRGARARARRPRRRRRYLYAPVAAAGCVWSPAGRAFELGGWDGQALDRGRARRIKRTRTRGRGGDTTTSRCCERSGVACLASCALDGWTTD